jgi:nitroreductase
MDIFECIEKRYSFRGSYKNTKVPRENLEKIMKAGLAAPSGGNKQTTSLIGLDDPALLDSVAETIGRKSSNNGGAQAGICVLAKKEPSYRNAYYHVQDYSAAIENMLLAAIGLGYESCWIEGEITANAKTQEKISEILNVPKEYILVAYLPVGVPQEAGNRPAYKPFAERAWFNGFGG